MTAEASGYLSAVKWADEAYYLKEFSEQLALPQVGKILKGQFASLGVPSLSAPSLNQTLFWSRGAKQVKLAAQCVKFKETRGPGPLCQAVAFGPRLSIPANYDGWFEILSEEGRAVRCIESVADLARRFPDSCLVRENIKCVPAKTPSDPSSRDSPLPSDRTRLLQVGETLTLVSADTISPGKSAGSCIRYLKCVTGSGETVFLNLDLRGKFSPIAKEGNISGVHTMKNLLNKRLPLMARLVCGKGPLGFKSFQPELRLYALFEEDCLIGMPLLKEASPICVPVSSNLKLVGPKNPELLTGLHEYASLVEKSNSMSVTLEERMEVLEPVTKDREVPPGHCHDHKRRFQSNCVLVKRCISDYQRKPIKKKDKSRLFEGSAWHRSEVRVSVPSSVDKCADSDSENNKCYEEIDQIYDYVRGFAPLPESVKIELAANKSQIQERPDSTVQRRLSYPTIVHDIAAKVPHPPNGVCSFSRQATQPHARVPVRSNSTGKIYLPHVQMPREPLLPTVQLKSKLFVKSPTGQRNTTTSSTKANRLLKLAKSAPSGDAHLVGKIMEQDENNQTYRSISRSQTTSPLFNIRYKSLTNLHSVAVSPSPPLLPPTQPVTGSFNSTLDSSNSGRQTSSASAGSKDPFKDPKPKTRKLSRPKSLTNLFWDMAAAVTFDRLHNEINAQKSAHHHNNNTINLNRVAHHGSQVMSIERISPDVIPMHKLQGVSPGHSTRKLGTLYL